MEIPAKQQAPLFDELPGFDPVGFAEKFGPYLWTYAAGYRELLHLFHVAHGKPYNRSSMLTVIAGWKDAAVLDIPPEWRAALTKDAEWEKLHQEQIENASKGVPMRMDKAYQSIRALQLAFQFSAIEALRTLDVTNIVRLRPAVWHLDEKSKSCGWLREGKGVHFDALVRQLLATRNEGKVKKAHQFLQEVSQGRAITCGTVATIQHHLRMAGYADDAFRPLKNRPVKGSNVVSDHEKCFIAPPAYGMALIVECHKVVHERLGAGN